MNIFGPITLMLIFVLSSACSLIYDDNPAECFQKTDCPVPETCVSGVCISPNPPQEFPDASVDEGVDFEPDLGSDASLDSEANDAGLVAPFGQGLCFEDTPDLNPELKSSYPPIGFCSPWARGWLEQESGSTRFTYGPGEDNEYTIIENVAFSTPRFAEHHVYLSVLNQNDTQTFNIYRHDLRTDARIRRTQFLRPSFRPQSHPARGANFTAFLQVIEGNKERVYVAQDDGDSFPCDRNGNDDTHTDLAASGDWVAWLERPVNGRCEFLVLAKARECSFFANQARWDLHGSIIRSGTRESVLQGADGALLWLEGSQSCRQALQDDGVTNVMIWPLKTAQRPYALALNDSMDGTPIELAAHPKSPFVGLIAWNRGPRNLYVLNIETKDVTPIKTEGLVAHPVVSESYIMWAEQSLNDGTWKVRYELLPLR